MQRNIVGQHSCDTHTHTHHIKPPCHQHRRGAIDLHTCPPLVQGRHVGKATVRTMLVTGADVLESFIKPGVWIEEQVREILGAHGVVCISR